MFCQLPAPLGPYNFNERIICLSTLLQLTTSLEINLCLVGARVSQDRKRDHVTYGTNNTHRKWFKVLSSPSWVNRFTTCKLKTQIRLISHKNSHPESSGRSILSKRHTVKQTWVNKTRMRYWPKWEVGITMTACRGRYKLLETVNVGYLETYASLADGIRDASNETKTFQHVKFVNVEGSQVSSECLCAFVFMSIWFSLQFFQLATLLTFESLGLWKRPLLKRGSSMTI